jgi:hypothetical protein
MYVHVCARAPRIDGDGWTHHGACALTLKVPNDPLDRPLIESDDDQDDDSDLDGSCNSLRRLDALTQASPPLARCCCALSSGRKVFENLAESPSGRHDDDALNASSAS